MSSFPFSQSSVPIPLLQLVDEGLSVNSAATFPTSTRWRLRSSSIARTRTERNCVPSYKKGLDRGD